MLSLWQNEQAHSGFSWRTCAACLVQTRVKRSGKFSMRWPKEASTRDGHVFEPTSQWVPAIGGSGGSVLPLIGTPTQMDAHGGQRSEEFRRGRTPTPVELAADMAVRLLPTPVVNDMGAGKTVEKWDAWTAEQREKHRNGNGHGKSLSIEVQRLLPTPTTGDSKVFGPNIDWKKRQENHHPSTASALMALRLNDGNESSADAPPIPPTNAV